jgi:hypothetical protein
MVVPDFVARRGQLSDILCVGLLRRPLFSGCFPFHRFVGPDGPGNFCEVLLLLSCRKSGVVGHIW